MILSSFTVIFTSVFQSNIELWIHFFSVDKFSCKCEGNVFQKKRLIVTKKTSPFSSFKSLLQKTSSPTKHRDDARPFVNTSKLFLPKHCFICRSRWQKHFFNSWKLSLFFNGWWNVHPWNRFHGWTFHWRFTKEESGAWTYTAVQRSLFHYLQKFMTVQYTA